MSPYLTGAPKDLNTRLPFDPEASKKLLADSGYPNGFSVGLSCPNDRYVYDENICLAVVSMLAKVGVKIEPPDRADRQVVAAAEQPGRVHVHDRSPPVCRPPTPTARCRR